MKKMKSILLSTIMMLISLITLPLTAMADVITWSTEQYVAEAQYSNAQKVYSGGKK